MSRASSPPIMAPDAPSSGLARFTAELRRRHVVRVALAYGAVGFVLLQAAEIVLPAFLPAVRADAALRVLVVGFFLLFPVVAALAWLYEITPHGIRTMDSLDAEAGRPPVSLVLPRVAFLALTVIAAGGAGLWWYRTDAAALAVGSDAPVTGAFVPASTADASGPIRSLAVLPLEDFSSEDDEGPAYFAAGMHEALISQLSQLGTVRVVSRTSIEGYPLEGKSVPGIGADLGVDAVVEGSVLQSGGRVRITVQLIHAASDTHLWAQDFERDLEDVITLQREVASAVASEIGARLGGGATGPADGAAIATLAEAEEPPAGAGAVPGDSAPARETTGARTMASVPDVAPPPPPSLEVQDAVLRGRFALRAPSAAPGEAEAHFREALAHDPTFVPALTGLAGTRLLRGLDEEGAEGMAELVEARDLAMTAVRRDPESVEAREILASVGEAMAELGERMAESRVMDLGGVRILKAQADSVLVISGADTTRLPAEAAPAASATEMGRLIHVAMARQAEPGATADGEIRSILRLEAAGLTQAALDRATTALERFPEHASLWDLAERLTASLGRPAELVELRRARVDAGVSAPGPGVESLAGRVAERGMEGYWAWKLEELDARERAGQQVSSVDRAAAHAGLGRSRQALELLEEASSARDPRLRALRSDPVWDPLRTEPRFQALLRVVSATGH